MSALEFPADSAPVPVDSAPSGRASWLRPYHIKPGERLNPNGPRGNDLYISTALRRLLAGEKPPEDAPPVWSVAQNFLRALLDQERLDARLLGLAMDRLEGKVPDRLEATVAAGVVMVPVAQMERQAWEDLAAATMAGQLGDAGAIEAALVKRPAPAEDEDGGA